MVLDGVQNKDTIIKGFIVVLGLVYVLSYHAWFGGTPMGLAPVLDGKQNIYLAKLIAEGDLSDEPFHRSPFYVLTLAFLLKLGLPFSMLPYFARLLNVVAILVIVWQTLRIHERLWGKDANLLFTGLLIAFYPVLVFFSAEPLDITIATTFFCVAIRLILDWLDSPSRVSIQIKIAIVLAIGSIYRSHILPIAFLWPFLALCCSYFHCRGKNWMLGDKLKYAFSPGLLAIIIALLSLLTANILFTGNARVMPWQGSYNLWLGNGPHAQGNLYAQQISVRVEGPHENPAKVESLLLYEQETGNTPPHDIDAMNRFWLKKTSSHVIDNPIQWFGLMARKAYYLVNNHEQYDNKTYGFQKGLSPILRYNPLGWAVVFTLFLGGMYYLAKKKPLQAYVILTLLVCYGLVVILFYTSNRFRVPMIPIFCSVAGAVPSLLFISVKEKAAIKEWVVLGSIGFIGLYVSLSGHWNVRGKDTRVADLALMASAANEVGEDRLALEYVDLAIALGAKHLDIWRTKVPVEYNLFIGGELRIDEDFLEARLDVCDRLIRQHPSPVVAFIAGVYSWKLGDPIKAEALWKLYPGVQSQDSIAALLMTDSDFAYDADQTPIRSPLLHYALYQRKSPEGIAWWNSISEERRARIASLANLLFTELDGF